MARNGQYSLVGCGAADLGRLHGPPFVLVEPMPTYPTPFPSIRNRASMEEDGAGARVPNYPT